MKGIKRVSAKTIIEDWGERTFFGKARNYSARGYSAADSGAAYDLVLEHQVIVDRVLLRFSLYEPAIRDHVRNVLELRVEGLHDLRRWPHPCGIWDQFMAEVGAQFNETERSRGID